VADFRHKENFHRPAPPRGGNFPCRHAPPCHGKILKNLHPWSQDAGYGEYEKDFRHYQRNEFHGHRENFKQYDYQSDEFRRRAQRVRENLHKNEQYAQHDQAYRDKQDEWAAQRKAEFEKLFQTRTEDAVNESRAREQELKCKL
jgi:hypothetical protein